ncbi:MAG: hypothetical protein AAFV29_15605, partial [Myxococcota bacterium]
TAFGDLSVLVQDVVSGHPQEDVRVLFTGPNGRRQLAETSALGRARAREGMDAVHVYAVRRAGFLHVVSFVGVQSGELVVREEFEPLLPPKTGSMLIMATHRVNTRRLVSVRSLDVQPSDTPISTQMMAPGVESIRLSVQATPLTRGLLVEVQEASTKNVLQRGLVKVDYDTFDERLINVALQLVLPPDNRPPLPDGDVTIRYGVELDGGRSEIAYDRGPAALMGLSFIPSSRLIDGARQYIRVETDEGCATYEPCVRTRASYQFRPDDQLPGSASARAVPRVFRSPGVLYLTGDGVDVDRFYLQSTSWSAWTINVLDRRLAYRMPASPEGYASPWLGSGMVFRERFVMSTRPGPSDIGRLPNADVLSIWFAEFTEGN